MKIYNSINRYTYTVVELLLVLSTILITNSIPAQQIASYGTELTFTNKLGMEFQLIQPGSMVVGRIELECPDYPDVREVDEKSKWTQEDFENCERMAKRHSRPGFIVTLQKPYYIGKYEVTQAQWKKVMGTNPSFFQGDRIDGKADSILLRM